MTFTDQGDRMVITLKLSTQAVTAQAIAASMGPCLHLFAAGTTTTSCRVTLAALAVFVDNRIVLGVVKSSWCDCVSGVLSLGLARS